MLAHEPGRAAFIRFAAIGAILSLPVAAANLLTTLLAVRFNLDAFTDPLVLMNAGSAGAAMWRWSMILDLFGYYLLIVPLIQTLQAQLRPQFSAWVDLCAFCVLAYCLIGAIGATILAAVTPSLIIDYAQAPASQRLALETVANSYSDAVYRGLWNLLEELLAGIGWMGFGLMLGGARRRLGLVTCVLGAACLVDASGSLLDFEPLALSGLAVYLVAAPVWACWTGIDLLRPTRSPG